MDEHKAASGTFGHHCNRCYRHTRGKRRARRRLEARTRELAREAGART